MLIWDALSNVRSKYWTVQIFLQLIVFQLLANILISNYPLISRQIILLTLYKCQTLLFQKQYIKIYLTPNINNPIMKKLPSFKVNNNRNCNVITIQNQQFISLPILTRNTLRVYGKYYYAVSKTDLKKISQRFY